MTLVVADAAGTSTSGTVNLIVQPNAAPTVGTYGNTTVGIGGVPVVVTPTSGPTDSNNNLPASPFTVSPTTLPGGGTVAINQTTGAVTLTPTAGSTAGARTIRVTLADTCGATLVREFTANVAATTPVMVPGGTPVFTAESCTPLDNAPSPGEFLTLSLPLSNTGAVASGVVTATLLPTGGVVNPSGSQSYGVVNPGSTVSRSFSFQANGSCGGPLTLTLIVSDPSRSYADAVFTLTFGTLSTTTTTYQNFDGVTAPALPAGWTTSVTGSITAWRTSTTTPHAGTNSAFVTPVSSVSESSLISPSITLPALTSAARLRFQHRWSQEDGYDGCVLEISINNGAWQDILAAGGSFVSGGYNSSIDTGYSSPIGGRQAWTGSFNSAYTATTVNLPAAALSQPFRVRFRQACDSSAVATSPVWRIDTLETVVDGRVCTASCGSPPAFTSSPPSATVIVGTSYSHQFTASGNPSPTFSLTSGTLPNGLTLSSSGLLSGTSTEGGNGTFAGLVVTASNGNPPAATQAFALSTATRLASYVASYGLTGNDALPDGDPDFDNRVNLLEYALGSVPNGPSPEALVVDTALVSGSRYLRLAFPRSSLATDLTYIVEVSDSPAASATWTEIGRSTGGGAITGLIVEENGVAPNFISSARDTTALGSTPRFIRLRITTP